MKSHIWRPLYAVMGIVALVLAVRKLAVPEDFGMHEKGYMYGWHKKSDEDYWKGIRVKYRSAEYCRGCHSDKYSSIMQTPHAVIQCENCHEAGQEHPVNPLKLPVDRGRELCLRCHAYLPYPLSDRAGMKGIESHKHNPDTECVMCHNPHNPSLAVFGR